MSPAGPIVRAAIHPAIGFARVGDSPDEHYFAPEVDDPRPEDAYKDATGALKREAARFRVYGYDADGQVVAELTAAEAEIAWTVQVANLKAAWYQFQLALDVPEASDPKLPPSKRRNASVAGAARSELAIEPAPATLSGANAAAVSLDGEFMGTDVHLGDVHTDGAGRLVFLGGHGVSASPDGQPPSDFANNDGWHDDVCDGPITARVTIDGQDVPVDPAWVVVGPPNYAPQVATVRTLHDLLYDANVQAGKLAPPAQVSFADDVYPILRRLGGLQWVNHGFATKFGFRGREDFMDDGYLRRLADPRPEFRELRQQIYNAFRNYERDGRSPNPWPWIYGDAMTLPVASVRQHLELSPTQMDVLTRWKDGKFEADLDRVAPGPSSLDEVPLADQPDTLDRAALKFCLADAFHPGCELTWPIRHLTMYMAPFRLLHRSPDDPEPDYGDVLTPERAVGADGPLHGQFPGSITRWMAMPWQTDTASCRNGYETARGFDPEYDPYLPTFWPARVPNEVLAEVDYEVVMDVDLPMAAREAAFERRAVWLRGLPGPDQHHQMDQMITEFGKLGVVEPRQGPSDGAFPGQLMVESEIGFDPGVNPNRHLHALHVPEARDPERAEAAIAAALAEVTARTGIPAEEFSAGYHSNIARFEPSGDGG